MNKLELTKVVTLALIAPIFLLAGCEKKDPVADLNELPAQTAAKLKLVPDLPLLATRIEPGKAHPSEPISTAVLCGKDWTYTYFGELRRENYYPYHGLHAPRSQGCK